MCNMPEVEKRANEILNNANNSIATSGALTTSIEREMADLIKKSEENIIRLSSLL